MSEFKERGENRRKTSQPQNSKGQFTREFGDRTVITKDRRKTPSRRDRHILYDNHGNEILECQ